MDCAGKTVHQLTTKRAIFPCLLHSPINITKWPVSQSLFLLWRLRAEILVLLCVSKELSLHEHSVQPLPTLWENTFTYSHRAALDWGLFSQPKLHCPFSQLNIETLKMLPFFFFSQRKGTSVNTLMFSPKLFVSGQRKQCGWMQKTKHSCLSIFKLQERPFLSVHFGHPSNHWQMQRGNRGGSRPPVALMLGKMLQKCLLGCPYGR